MVYVAEIATKTNPFVFDDFLSLGRYRNYDAEVGRWLTKDPILFHGGDANLYGYVLMEPVNFVDLTGMFLSKPKSRSRDRGENWHLAAEFLRPFIYKTCEEDRTLCPSNKNDLDKVICIESNPNIKPQPIPHFMVGKEFV